MLDTKNYKIPKIYSYLILSILIVSLLWLLIRLNNSIPYETLGYLGIYISSLISASSIFIPIPGIGAVCVGSLPSLGLNPLLIGLIAGLAESIGELTGYFTGRSFSGSFKENRLKDYLYKKMNIFHIKIIRIYPLLMLYKFLVVYLSYLNLLNISSKSK